MFSSLEFLGMKAIVGETCPILTKTLYNADFTPSRYFVLEFPSLSTLCAEQICGVNAKAHVMNFST